MPFHVPTYIQGTYDKLNVSSSVAAPSSNSSKDDKVFSIYETAVSFNLKPISNFENSLCRVRFETPDDWKIFGSALTAILIVDGRNNKVYCEYLRSQMDALLNLSSETVYKDSYVGLFQWTLPLFINRKCQEIINKSTVDDPSFPIVKFMFISYQQKLGFMETLSQQLIVNATTFDASQKLQYQADPSRICAQILRISYDDLHGPSGSSGTKKDSKDHKDHKDVKDQKDSALQIAAFAEKQMSFDMTSLISDRSKISQILIHPPNFEKNPMMFPNKFQLFLNDKLIGSYDQSYDAHYTDKVCAGFAKPTILLWSMTAENWMKTNQGQNLAQGDKLRLEVTVCISKDNKAKFSGFKEFVLHSWII